VHEFLRGSTNMQAGVLREVFHNVRLPAQSKIVGVRTFRGAKPLLSPFPIL